MAANSRQSATPVQGTEAEKLEAHVLSVMPPTWRPQLVQEVAEHVAKYSK
jgi:hypothetical protein